MSRWLALESNPDVLNEYIHQLGVPKEVRFVDVLGTDPDLLAFVPQPVHAVVFLFPICDASEEAKAKEAAKIKKDGQTVSDNVVFIKQTIANACGTMAVLHAIGNTHKQYKLVAGSPFAKLFDLIKDMSPEDAAALLEKDDKISAAHTATAKKGQTETPALDAKVPTHFVTFAVVDDCLYEFDGRKIGPINHGKCRADQLLPASIQVIKQFIARDPDSNNFTIMALTSGGDL